MPDHEWTTGEKPSAANLNLWLRNQVSVIDTYANISAIASPLTGRRGYATDKLCMVEYNGTSWVPFGVTYISSGSLPGSPLTGHTNLSPDRGYLERYNGSAWVRVNSDGLFGDGTDGAVAMDGTNTYASFASKSGNAYTLLRDIYPTTLAITGSATLEVNGFRIFAKTSVTCSVAGGIQSNGGSASGATAGAGALNNSIAAVLGNATTYASNGATGGAGAGASSTAPTNSSMGAQGGAGGTGNGGANAAGSAGAVTALTVGQGHSSMFNRPDDIALRGRYLSTGSGTAAFLSICAASGGGAGGGGSGNGGGGGGGAGLVFVCSPLVTGTGSITAVGGNGGNAPGTNAGGGGGGGGGFIWIVTLQALGGSVTLNVAGGTLGTKTGTGVNGNVGSAGTAKTLVLV